MTEQFIRKICISRPQNKLFKKLGEQLQIEAFLAERKILVYTVVHELFETA